jgi:excisionase family DNA binding protein
MKQLLTVAQAAERLQLKEATIRRMILEKRIVYVKISRSVRIPEDELERLIKEGVRLPVNR